jgi:peroxiredoxin
LGQLSQVHEDLVTLGYRLVAVSPDLPEKLRATVKKHETGYVLLSDSKMTASRAFGIAHTVDDETLELYAGYGIDLEEASGETHHELPVPSVFVIGKSGKIDFEYVNPNYKVRLDPDVLLAAAKSALE